MNYISANKNHVVYKLASVAWQNHKNIDDIDIDVPHKY